MLIDILVIAAAYIMGSVSSAIIVCRLMSLPDPRTQGSNNPGATNVLRIGGKKAAAITLLGDMLKGLIPVLIAQFLLEVAPWTLALTGAAAFLGHLYPVFFGFKGGKGVATAMGVQLGWHWALGLCVAGIWLFIAKGLKISSLAALIAMALAPLFAWLFIAGHEVLLVQIPMTLLLIWRHRSNIQNLLSGREDKIGGTDG